MPQFPRPPRARRLTLRRTSRYPSTYSGHSTGGGSWTRRGLLGATGLVAAGGVVDLIRTLTRGSSSVATSTLRTRGGGLTSPGTPAPTHAASPQSAPTHTASPPATHTRAPTHSHGSTHAHGAHGTQGHQPKKRYDPPAKLPPAKLKQRSKPAYQVSDLISNPPRHAIALTIDDGPDPSYTPHVLRLLDKLNLQASFCVVGEHADAYPRLVKDVVKAGHIVVNHSYTHAQPFAALPQKRIVWEITKTQRAIERASGFTPQLFRSPGGDWSTFIYRALAAYGLEPLDWDVDPEDWMQPGSKVIERRMLRARPGEIVLCHDGGGDRSETVRALKKVLPVWKRRGYHTIALSITPHYLPQKPTGTPSSSPSVTSNSTPSTGPTATS